MTKASMTPAEAAARHRDYPRHSESLINLIQQTNSRRVAEVGVYESETATKVLEACPDLILYCMVDPWAKYDGTSTGMSDAGCPAGVDWDSLFVRAMALKDKYNAAEVLRMKSVDAAMQVPIGSLDLVFIDGDHSYDAVLEDIAAWCPNVKDGGIIAGHDYYNRWPGTVKAVDDSFEASRLQFLPDTVWYVIK